MKNRYRIILLFMAISLFGIILIQVLWIRSAIRAEEARFDKSVYNAMNSGIASLKQQDLFVFIDRKIDLPRPSIRYDSIIERYIPPPARVEVLKVDSNLFRLPGGKPALVIADSSNTYRYLKVDTSGQRYLVDWHFDSFGNADHDVIVDVIVDDQEGSEEDELVLTKEQLEQYRETVELENLEDLQALQYKEQIVIMEQQLDSIEKIIREREKIRAEKEMVVAEKMEEFSKTMQQWAFEYSFDDNWFQTTGIMDEKIQSTFRRALVNNGINLDFNLQVIRQDGDSIQVISGSDKPIKSAYKTELFPADLFRKNLFVLLNFPERSQYILRSVAWLGTGSLLFTAIILLTFGITLYYIHKQKKLSEIKSDFINNMTHEFKTPIATISLASDTMGSPKVLGNDTQLKHYLDIIRQENKRMNNQVEKVLQMALIENQDFHLDFQKTDIHAILQNTIRVAELMAKEKGGRIVALLRATCSEIPVDEIHFANIINNLLDNAMKYTEKVPEILVETLTKDHKLVIRISDNGVGMSKEVQKHIFEKFYRKPSGNIHNVKGFGLGLSYVKAIVNAHGGSISVTSEPGNGSIFTIEFDC